MTDRVGQYLGNYRLLRVLGQGAFATVYLGEHQYLERLAAIKVLHVLMETSTHEAFRREARTIARLEHPHIIGVYDFGFQDNTPYLVMEYLPEGTLRERFPKGTRLSFEQIVSIVAQIASALDYAHEHQIIHRDVKPENILLGPNEQVVLSDFGIAVVESTHDSLSPQNPAGTPLYMAPEQIRHRPGPASDQYALGVMVYEWFCGEPPFHGSLFEVWSQHLLKPPPSLCARVQGLPQAVEDTVFGTLAKDPQHRFPTVQEFAAALLAAYDATQPLAKKSVVHGLPVQEKIRPSLAPVRLVPVLSPGEQDHSDEATQPLRNAVQRIEAQSTGMSKVAAQLTIPPSSASMQFTTVRQQARLETRQSQNRVRMLQRLRHAYTDMMSQSLQGTAWLELGMASKADAVHNAAHLLLRMERSTEELLPAGTSIIQAYDEAEQELLILGEPGGGKSTLLLNLAAQLVVRAEQDETHPLPVILPLSTWAVKRGALRDWIAEQMSEIYDVPRKLSGEWVQEGHILPLLDGLDEMNEMARAACIVAINTYHRERMAALVVCSRTTEYEAATEHARLALHGAVVVQPLTREHVDAYFVQAGKPLMALHSTLKKNAVLQLLATTPLMLNILILTYQERPVHDLPNKQAALLQQVWNDYIERMVTRKGSIRHYPLEETRARLCYLAGQMRDHNQTVFYLEHLQPDWLEASQQHIYAGLAVRLPTIVIGCLISILVSLFFAGFTTSLSSLLQYGALGGLLGGVFRKPGDWGGHEHRDTWGKRLVKRLAVSICIGLIFAFGVYISPHYASDQWLIDSLCDGVIIAGGCLLLQYLLAAPFRSRSSLQNDAPRGWKRVLRFFEVVQGPRALLVAIVIGLSAGLGTGLSRGLNAGWLSAGLSVLLGSGLEAGPNAGLILGVSYALMSLALGAQTETIHLTERMSWTWRGLFKFRHLSITALITCASSIFAWLSYALSNMIYYAMSVGLSEELKIELNGGLIFEPNIGLSAGLCAGLSYWFVLGLLQGVTQERIKDQDRRVVNQGLHRCLRNSVIISVVSGAIIGSFGILSYALSIGLTFALAVGLSTGLSYGLRLGLSAEPSYYGPVIGISSALLIFMLTGGLAVWRHYIIRFLLSRSHTFPGRAPQFLDDTVARILLRRIGGGYSFVHRLLLDHLADAATSTSMTTRSEPASLR